MSKASASGLDPEAVHGLSTGVFAHVALDLVPNCSGGGSGHDNGSAAVCSPDQDRRRVHAVASTVGGVAALFLVWLAVA